jgi:hypothetical protein
MTVIDSKTSDELLRSLLAENAKATNELRCAQGDLNKAQSRLTFTVALLNELIKRQEIK